MEPIEEMTVKKISPPRSGWGAIHDGKNMASGITISCLGDGSYIGDHKLIWPKSRLQPKFQGWARVSKVLEIVAKLKSKSENLSLLSSLNVYSLARQNLAHEAARTLAGHLVDTRFADRWRCQNQAYLDNSHLALTRNHESKKNSIW